MTPRFPFVGVIEHTNFEPLETYGGHHIVYLSKYLPETDPLYQMADAEVVDFTLEHLARMFPDLTRNWVLTRMCGVLSILSPLSSLITAR